MPKLHFGTPLSAQFHCGRAASGARRRATRRGGQWNCRDKCVPQLELRNEGDTVERRAGAVCGAALARRLQRRWAVFATCGRKKQGCSRAVQGCSRAIQPCARTVQGCPRSVQACSAAVQGCPGAVQPSDAAVQACSLAVRPCAGAVQGSGEAVQCRKMTAQGGAAAARCGRGAVPAGKEKPSLLPRLHRGTRTARVGVWSDEVGITVGG